MDDWCKDKTSRLRELDRHGRVLSEEMIKRGMNERKNGERESSFRNIGFISVIISENIRGKTGVLMWERVIAEEK